MTESRRVEFYLDLPALLSPAMNPLGKAAHDSLVIPILEGPNRVADRLSLSLSLPLDWPQHAESYTAYGNYRYYRYIPCGLLRAHTIAIRPLMRLVVACTLPVVATCRHARGVMYIWNASR